MECLGLPQALRCLLQSPLVSSKLKIRSSEIRLAQFTVRSEPWFTSSGSKDWFTINLVHVHIVHRKGVGGPCPSSTPLAPLFMGISLLLRPLFTSLAEIGFSLNWKVFQNILLGHPSMLLLGHQGMILLGHLVRSLSFSSSGRLSLFLFSLTWTQPASNLSETLQYIQTISITGFRFFSNLS